MNGRRSFLKAAVALPAMLPALSIAEVDYSRGRLTCANPPEPGFTYAGKHRYQVYCDEVPVQSCTRVDMDSGVAWVNEIHRHADRVVISEKQIRGKIRMVRIA